MEMEKKQELYDKGKNALEYNKLEEAEQYFQEILAEEPNEADVLNKMGIIFIYRKDWAKAREYFEKTLEINKEHVHAMCNLGSVELEEGNMNKAEMLYREALRIDEKYGTAHNNLAYILKKTGRYSEAVKHMKKAQKGGVVSFDLASDKNLKFNTGCAVIFVLIAIALLLWYFTQ